MPLSVVRKVYLFSRWNFVVLLVFIKARHSCQCGISRSATLVIGLVMRAAETKSNAVPIEVWELKGYHDAYAYVKARSKWIGPNMS